VGPRVRSNTFSENTLVRSDDSNGNKVDHSTGNVLNPSDGGGKSRTIWHDDSSNNNSNPIPVAPKRTKKKAQSYKITALKKPPNHSNKSDSLGSNQSSSSSGYDNHSSCFYQHPTKRPFAQLHMDHGAAILKDRDLFWLKVKGCLDDIVLTTDSVDSSLCGDTIYSSSASVGQNLDTNSRLKEFDNSSDIAALS